MDCYLKQNHIILIVIHSTKKENFWFALLKMSQELDLQDVKYVDLITSILIYGYIRESQATFDLSYNVPELIFNICLLFYFEREYWDKHGENIVINTSNTSNDTALLKASKHKWKSAYGKASIDLTSNNTIFKWTVRLDSSKCAWYLAVIGIITDTNSQERFAITMTKSAKYYYIRTGLWGGYKNNICSHECGGKPDYNKMICQQPNIYDITITVNSKQRSVRFECEKDNNAVDLECKNIDCDGKYHLFISMYNPSVSMQIIQFKQELMMDQK